MAYGINKWQTASEKEYIIKETERMFGAKYDENGKVVVPYHHMTEDGGK